MSSTKQETIKKVIYFIYIFIYVYVCIIRRDYILYIVDKHTSIKLIYRAMLFLD